MYKLKFLAETLTNDDLLLRQVLSISEKKNYHIITIFAKYDRAVIFYQNGDFDTSAKLLKEIFENDQYEHVMRKNHPTLAQMNFTRSLCYGKLDNNSQIAKKTLLEFENSFDCALNHKPDDYIRFYTAYARFCLESKENEKAFDCLMKCKSYIEEKKETIGFQMMGYYFMMMGVAERDTKKNYDIAIYNFKKSREYYEKFQPKEGDFCLWLDVLTAECYEYLEKYEETWEFIKIPYDRYPILFQNNPKHPRIIKSKEIYERVLKKIKFQ